MKFRRIEQKSIMRAILLGATSGLVGVAMFIFLLQQSTTLDDTIPVVEQPSTSAPAPLPFYAAQHGTFSSKEAATNYMKSYPSLNLGVVVEVDGQFYVWSELSTVAQWDKEVIVPTSFAKALFVSEGQCSETDVVARLADNANVTREQAATAQLPDDWINIVEAIGQLTPNAQAVRLHVFAHYLQSGCLNVAFTAS